MKRGFTFALVVAGCLMALPQYHAQTPAGSGAPGSAQNKAPAGAQKPAGAQQQPVPPAASNPFPEDTSSVPVLPSKGTANLPEGTYDGADSGRLPLPGEDMDPVRSPEDPAPAAGSGQQAGSSSSLADMDKLLPGSDDDQPQKRNKKGQVIEPEHQETAAEDINVGKYYLDNKNWKASLSRFQSAMVLSPDDPEVYWGLAESERHLGDFADARAYYQKVVDYDPESRHGKDARKALKEPEIANAQNHSPSKPSSATTR